MFSCLFNSMLMPSVKGPHPELCPRLRPQCWFEHPNDDLEIFPQMYKKLSCLCSDPFLSTHYNHSSGSTAFVHCHFSNADLSNG